jgi:hypothetical protein
MAFNPSIDVNSWKSIQWSNDPKKLDSQLTELMLKLSTWAQSAHQQLVILQSKIAAAGGGTGDMLKSVYDTDNNGLVDSCDSLPYSRLTGAPAVPAPSSTTPLMDGTAAVGTGTTYARADHVHPSDTTRVPTTRQVLTSQSLSGGGDLSVDRTLTLNGDSASPGNTMLYGTNASGVKGWYSQPTGLTGPPAGFNYWPATVGGTVNALTLTNSPPLTSLINGTTFTFPTLGSNTGAVTCNVDSIGALAVVTPSGTALTGKEMRTPLVTLFYANSKFYLAWTWSWWMPT